MSKPAIFLAALVASLAAPALASAQECKDIVSRVVKLDGRNDEWVSADLKVKPSDLVVVFVGGQVEVGKVTGKVTAAGDSGTGYGKVEMKIGTGTVVTVGTRYTAVADDSLSGTVKFRVWDTNYRDNSGEYSAVIVVIPDSAIPEPKQVAAD